jgi:microcystin-dependent protein
VPAGTVGNTTLTEAQMPWHSHRVPAAGNAQPWLDNPNNLGGNRYGNIMDAYADGAGGNQPHGHSFTGTAMNLAVQYVDVIIASKD